MQQRGQSDDGCVEVSILCKYDKRKGDLFVLSWARVRRVCRGKFSSVLLTCGGRVHNILLLSLVCMSHTFAFMSAIVRASAGVCEIVCGISEIVEGCGFH